MRLAVGGRRDDAQRGAVGHTTDEAEIDARLRQALAEVGPEGVVREAGEIGGGALEPRQPDRDVEGRSAGDRMRSQGSGGGAIDEEVDQSLAADDDHEVERV